LAHHFPLPPTSRRRSYAAAALRRARAIDLGFYKPKPSSTAKAFIEVPKPLRSQAKDIIRGKILKTTREAQLGQLTHSTRLAALAAHKANLTSKEEFAKDTKIVKRQNAANHGSPKMRTPWADIHDDIEDTLPEKIKSALTNGSLTIIETKALHESNQTICDLQSWINWWNVQATSAKMAAKNPPTGPKQPNCPPPPIADTTPPPVTPALDASPDLPVQAKSEQPPSPAASARPSDAVPSLPPPDFGMHLTTRGLLMETLGMYDSEDLDLYIAKKLDL
jgi:hypothetical protein